MSTHSGTGMSTYEKILIDARVSGQKIGPKHHMYDKQKQEWAKSNKIEVKNVITSAVASELKTKIANAATSTKKAVQNTVKVVAKVVASVRVPVLPTQQELREKLKKENMKKLADSLKANDRTDHIKSVGNGL